jgi:hypothetical protein
MAYALQTLASDSQLHHNAPVYVTGKTIHWAARDGVCTCDAASWASAGILEPSFASYLRNFTEHSAPQPDPAAKLFLLRNFVDGQAADPGAMPPAAGVELTNGLECKIATATSKVPCRSMNATSLWSSS